VPIIPAWWTPAVEHAKLSTFCNSSLANNTKLYPLELFLLLSTRRHIINEDATSFSTCLVARYNLYDERL